MRGHLAKRGDKKYIVLSLGRDASGKRIRKWVPFHGTDKEADKEITRLSYQYDTNSLSLTSKTKAGEFLKRFLEDYAALKCAPRTFEGYESIIRYHFIPAFGELPLEKINTPFIQSYYKEKLKTLSPTTVNHHHTLLHKALKTAKKWRLLNYNPADDAEPPAIEQPDFEVWKPAEVNIFLELIKSNNFHYTLFYTAIYTGMRRSEYLALRWKDIDFDNNLISVNRVMHQMRKTREFYFRQPKTKKSRRAIAMQSSLVEALKVRKVQQADELKKLNIIQDDDTLVFCHFNGSPIPPDYVSHVWIKYMKKYKLKKIRLHDARHTNASIYLRAGVGLKNVQEKLGHADVSTTGNIYSHIIKDGSDEPTIKFDKLLGHG